MNNHNLYQTAQAPYAFISIYHRIMVVPWKGKVSHSMGALFWGGGGGSLAYLAIVRFFGYSIKLK